MIDLTQEELRSAQKVLNEYRTQVHKWAVGHGFWDEKRNVGEIMFLINSEMSELIDAHRINKRADYTQLQGIDDLSSDAFKHAFLKNAKDTIDDEMADIFFRILDYMGFEKMLVDIDSPFKYYYLNQSFTGNLAEYFLGLQNLTISYNKLYSSDTRLKEKKLQLKLDLLLFKLLKICRYLSIDYETAFKYKLAYNALRPYKNGKQY